MKKETKAIKDRIKTVRNRGGTPELMKESIYYAREACLHLKCIVDNPNKTGNIKFSLKSAKDYLQLAMRFYNESQKQ